MPELPEVEVVCRQLAYQIVGNRITSIHVYLEKSLQYRETTEQDVIGAVITAVERRGKYILIHTDRNQTLLVHLRMTGALIDTDQDAAKNYTHVRVRFELSSGRVLLYKDVRTFGGIWVYRTDQLFGCPMLSKLGVEPLTEAFTGAYLYKKTRGRRVPIKQFILNQEMISGIGNIYADESLFLSGIRPTRPAGQLGKISATRLVAAIKRVLSDSIQHGGTSFRDYRDGNGERGKHSTYLKVYGRGNEKCTVCGRMLNKVKIGGRTTVFCPRCQRR